MGLLERSERGFLNTLSQLAYCNPFLPRRLELERQALGDEFSDDAAVWSKRIDLQQERPNVARLRERIEQLAGQLRQRLVDGRKGSGEELDRYEDLVFYLLYYRYSRRLGQSLETTAAPVGGARRIGYWKSFLSDLEHYLKAAPRGDRPTPPPAHLLACFFQVRRAFHHIFHFVVGESLPAARLRAAIWQSIFTHDMRRFRRSLYDRMGDVTTLVVGPSGTGKELVARAVGLSRYIPFDSSSQQFREDFAGSFHALNLSALSPTLIESELFGHRRGSFTGAIHDRTGWLEICPRLGTVFLDEIGELDAAIQVKLLRVLETRAFQRLGETDERCFQGKIIAATNRDLAVEMRAGRFREDFYYRLCSDVIRTPTLQEQLADSPDDLGNLVRFLARRIAGDEAEALGAEVEAWVEQQLGRDYPWPGNIRELEQCVRNVMIRKEYRPPPPGVRGAAIDPQVALAEATQNGAWTVEELTQRYCSLVYAKTGSYERAAKQLGLDRRTVRSKVQGRFRAADGP